MGVWEGATACGGGGRPRALREGDPESARRPRTGNPTGPAQGWNRSDLGGSRDRGVPPDREGSKGERKDGGRGLPAERTGARPMPAEGREGERVDLYQ